MENSKTKQVSLSSIGKTIFAVGISASVLSLNFADKASAVLIDNGTVQLGVDTFGQLGTAGVGLKYLPTGNESITPGCVCEGWGVADAGSGVTGYANNSSGTAGITGVSLTSTATTATSIVNILGGAATRPSFQVTHSFAPSITSSLYSVLINITNTSTVAATDVRYRRVMDWDIQPTPFNEFSTIGGTVGASKVLFANDNGFATANPLGSRGSSLVAGAIDDFVDSGPADHGALFDFGLGALAAGASTDLTIFYGGAATEKEAFAALGRVGAEIYSLGQPSSDKDGLGGAGLNTFIFGFKGVGGVALPNPDPIVLPPSSESGSSPRVGTTAVPEPFTIVGTLIGGTAALRMRKKLKSNDKV